MTSGEHDPGVRRTWVGWLLLAGAAGLVGVAIALDNALGRSLNGIGGVMWLVGAGLLLGEARRRRLGGRTWLVVALTVVALSSLLSPRDLDAATVDFYLGGAIVGLLSRSVPNRLVAVGLLPALWLPTHLGLAAGRALYRSLADQPAEIRTDPPPTAALVPLAMILASLAGGATMGYLSRRRGGDRLRTPAMAEQRER